MNTGKITGLAHIGIFVKDIEISTDFYKRLGFTLDKEEQPGIRLAFLSAGNCLIELIEQKDMPARTAGLVDHVAMVVDDIDAAIKNAKAQGIEIDSVQVNSVEILGGIKNVFSRAPTESGWNFLSILQPSNKQKSKHGSCRYRCLDFFLSYAFRFGTLRVAGFKSPQSLRCVL